MLDLDGNPDGRFSHVAAHFIVNQREITNVAKLIVSLYKVVTSLKFLDIFLFNKNEKLRS